MHLWNKQRFGYSAKVCNAPICDITAQIVLTCKHITNCWIIVSAAECDDSNLESKSVPVQARGFRRGLSW